MPTKPKQWSYLSELHSNKAGAERLPGVDFAAMFAELKEAGIQHVELIVTEIVDWDRAPMRNFLHGVQVEAFTQKYNETCQHPNNGHFHTSEVKDFLKAKFLGWDINSELWEKWHKVFKMNNPIPDIFAFIKIQELNSTLPSPIKVASSEKLTPHQYLRLINDVEAYYYTLFKEMYDIRAKPTI